MIQEMGRRPRSVEVTEEVLAHGLPSLAWGTGNTLVYLRGFSTNHTNPSGLQRQAEIQLLRPLARQFRIHAVARPPGLPSDVTMADIAAQHADAIEGRFRGPVDVLGVSSGGSIALQLAADHAALVRRLVVAASGYRLGEDAREAQRRYVAATAASRRGAHYLAPFKVNSRLAGMVAVPVMWLLDPLLRPEDPSDMVAFASAEDAFNLADKLPDIAAPTLVIAGERDRVYPAAVVAATASRVQHGRLITYPRTGHGGTITHRRFTRDVASFLLEH
jgi:pimeloyl-ACP methyl ester carboxylesterase